VPSGSAFNAMMISWSFESQQLRLHTPTCNSRRSHSWMRAIVMCAITTLPNTSCISHTHTYTHTHSARFLAETSESESSWP
jgi:hypothetical protein